VSTHSVEIESVVKRFDQVAAVDGVSLDIHRAEFFSLLGPSGCGKTTLLRMIAGFELPTSGIIRIDGQDVTNTPPYARPVNLVFQHYALFPHLSVQQNVAFGLRYQNVSRAQMKTRVSQALEQVRLSGLDRRMPDQLSGGQRQRVALARALVLQPKVLLLDEPLGALDQKLRKEMQVELKNLQRQLGITFIFVTHDQEEALTMSDRIAVMNAGKVEQVDTAATVFERPTTHFVAGFMGNTNFFSATVLQTNGSTSHVRGENFETTIVTTKAPSPGEQIEFIVRPEKLRLSPQPSNSDEISLPVTPIQRIYQGINTIWTVRTSTGQLLTVCRQNTEPFAQHDETAALHICWHARHAVILNSKQIEPRRHEDTKELQIGVQSN
jgi:spermidine/putrescine transport system ATP-binding protein